MRNTQRELEKEWDSAWSKKNLLTHIVNIGRRFYNIFFQKFLSRFVNKNTSIIEFGCGTASLGFLLSKDIAHYHGIDISPAIVQTSSNKAVQLKNHNMTFSIGDCRDLNNEHKNRYDIAWSQGLLEHFDKPLPVLQSHIDAVRDGGVVVASVPARYSIHHLWYVLTRPSFLRKLWPWTEQIFFTKKSLGELGSKSKLQYKALWLPPFGIGAILGILILEIKK